MRLTKGTTELLGMLRPEPRGLQVLETAGGRGHTGQAAHAGRARTAPQAAPGAARRGWARHGRSPRSAAPRRSPHGGR